MKDKEQKYIDFFTRMQEENKKIPLGEMAWSTISWWLYNAINEDGLFTKDELADMFPDLLGYLKDR